MVDLLVSSGGKVDARDRGEATPLHWAARMGSAPVVQALLRRGASKKALNKSEMTALQIAEQFEFEEVIALLK